MAKSMNETLEQSSPKTSEDSRSATSSPASEYGPTLFDSPDGPTLASAGPEAAPVLPSRRQAKEKGLMTLVTSGLIGYDSSASESLQSSLENRLMTRLDTAGSTLYRLTWRRKRTPLGRRYLERAAWADRTSGGGFTGWQTPKLPTGGGQMERQTEGGGLRK